MNTKDIILRALKVGLTRRSPTARKLLTEELMLTPERSSIKIEVQIKPAPESCMCISINGEDPWYFIGIKQEEVGLLVSRLSVTTEEEEYLRRLTRRLTRDRRRAIVFEYNQPPDVLLPIVKMMYL